MRVLHLIDGGFRGLSPGQGDVETAVRACRLLVEHADFQQPVCVLGPRASAARVEGLGLRVEGVISPGLGLPELGWRGLRRLLEAWGRPDVIQAWGPRPARLALRAVGDSVRRVAVLPEGDAGPADVALTFSQSAASRLEATGSEVARVVVAPAPAWREERADREALRRELGVGADEVMVVQLGGAPQADALRMMFLIGLLREGKANVRGVIGPRARGRLRAVTFERGVDTTWVRTSTRSEAELVAAADLACFDGGGPSPAKDWEPSPWSAPAAILPAFAAGIPVVTPGWALQELGAPPGCAAFNSTLPELARLLLKLIEDAPLRAEAACAARELARGRAERFVRAVSDVWDEAAVAGPIHG